MRGISEAGRPRIKRVIDYLGRFRHRLGIDRAVGYSLLNSVVGNGLRAISLIVTLQYLSEAELGFYYTIQSLLAMQIFFELGFGLVLQQSAAHEFGKLSWIDGRISDEDPRSKSRLASLFRVGRRWYAFGSLIFAVLLVPVGWYFLADEGGKRGIVWIAPWIISVAATALTLAFSPVTVVINGCGRMDATARVSFFTAIVQHTVYWFLLICGMKLAAFPLSALLATCMNFVWLRRQFRLPFRDLAGQAIDPAYTWRKELWPFQWRLSISWIAGYFIFQVVTPYVFKAFDAETAGRVGLTIAVSGIMGSFGMLWLGTKIPTLGSMASRGEFDRMDALFRLNFIRATVIVVALQTLLFAALAGMNILKMHWATRFLPLDLFPAIVIFQLSTHLSVSFASYLRACRMEKFLYNSLAVAVSIIVLIAVQRRNPDLYVILYGYGLIGMAAAIYGYFLFVSGRREIRATGVLAVILTCPIGVDEK